MRKDKVMTLEEHLQVADDLAIAFHYLQKAYSKCDQHYPKTDKLMTAFFDSLPSVSKSRLASVKHLLDEEYHKIISKTQLEEHGNIYYSLGNRYKNLDDCK